MSEREQAIVTNDLRKTFKSRAGPVEAVRGVNISIGSGEIFGLLGPNGAGKTTTLRMLTTLLPIDSGTAVVAGFDVGREPKKVRERIGYVGQLGGADQLATGRENLILQGRLYGRSLSDLLPRVQEIADILDLSEFIDRKVKTYSGGQRRRLDVGLGIVHQPSVLFLDEPTTGLDPQNRQNLWEHLRKLQDLGTTMVLTTHYLEEADVLCDEIVIVDHGKIVAEGTPRDLKKRVAGDSIVITIKDPAQRSEKSSELLAGQPYVREVSVEGDQFRLYVEDGGAAMPELLRLLDAEQIGIRSMSLSEPTLDDVFLSQTGRSLRDTGAETSSRAEAAA
ncbi:MAG: ATP-binding cassette domain-containing protein [Acidimicrobiales bacterium]